METDPSVDDVRRQLREFADGAPVEDLLPGTYRKAQSRHRARRVGSACVAVSVVMSGVYVAGQARSANQTPLLPSGDRTRITQTGPPYPSTGPATAAALASGHWTRMAPAPVTARSGAASAWTGRELLVWGGANDAEFGDGAAYDPATDNWRQLPPAPLSARTAVASVWTGTQWFLWGGQQGAHVLGDGALYDPATNRWTPLSGGPLGARGGATAVWDGHEVLLFGGWGDARAALTAADGAGYDPTAGKWRQVLPAPMPEHTAVYVEAVAAGPDVYVWAQWANTLGGGIVNGTTALRFDTKAWQWHAVEASTPIAVSSPLWTGRELLLPAQGPFFTHRHPAPMNVVGYRRTPDATAFTALPHGPVDDCNPTTTWTGAALIAGPVGCSDDGPPGAVVKPGDIAAWDPQTNRWSPLAKAPDSGGDIVVWTGDRLLDWGSAHPTGGALHEVGLVLRG